MDVLTYDDYKQKIHLDNLGFILLMPILIDFLSVIVQQFGMSGSSVITMALSAAIRCQSAADRM